jgi:hypothetical protein
MGTDYQRSRHTPVYVKFEPNPGESNAKSDESESKSSASREDEIGEEFYANNSWRLSMLQWCECRHCNLKMTHTIESVYCYEKATEYD